MVNQIKSWDKVRLGVIGMGRQGQIHSRNIASMDRAELVCVSDVNPKAKSLPAVEGVKFYLNHSEVIQRNDVDAVVIASSTDTHEEIILEACSAGKHIFCEKPIASQLEAIDRSLLAVKKAGIKFMTAFNRRFDPSFRKVRALVEEGKVGKPHIINITSRDPAPPHMEYLKVSGGIFFDCTIHDFDMARYLSGDEIVEVYATGSVLVDPEIGKLGDLDTTMILLKFQGGALGSINNSRQAVYGYDQRVEVFGPGGCAVAYNETPTRVAFFDAEGTHTDKPLYFNTERYPESFFGEMEAFVDCIIHDKEPLVTGRDGRLAVVIAMAAKQSFEENKPVQIDL